MSKKSRLNAILDIITQQEISTQTELTDKLIELGFNVSQSTVSRDINELNLIKVAGAIVPFKYAKAQVLQNEVPDSIINLFKQITTSIECANNLIVIKTLSGNAGTAGMAIDSMHFPQILGTIAGDDTVLVIAKSNAGAEIILKTLRTL